jgi:hypothetical protein
MRGSRRSAKRFATRGGRSRARSLALGITVALTRSSPRRCCSCSAGQLARA